MELEQGCEYCGAVMALAKLQKVDMGGGAVKLACSDCAAHLLTAAQADGEGALA